MTVVATCKQQPRNVLNYLTQASDAANRASKLHPCSQAM
jgi:hypothetical protein